MWKVYLKSFYNLHLHNCCYVVTLKIIFPLNLQKILCIPEFPKVGKFSAAYAEKIMRFHTQFSFFCFLLRWNRTKSLLDGLSLLVMLTYFVNCITRWVPCWARAAQEISLYIYIFSAFLLDCVAIPTYVFIYIYISYPCTYDVLTFKDGCSNFCDLS